jgi:hypothetical protein
MNTKKFKITGSLLRIVLTIISMTICILLTDLYVPIKKILIYSEELTTEDVIAQIHVKQYILSIVVVSIAVELWQIRRLHKEEMYRK